MNSSTMVSVASDEPELTTTISAKSRKLSRHFPMQAASLRQMIAALSASALSAGAGGSERGREKVAGCFKSMALLS